MGEILLEKIIETMDIPVVKTHSVSYIDHNTLQDGFENTADHRYLLSST